MNEIWFIGDSHFGHKNILQFEPVNRPFTTLEEMHEAMIDRWNGVVKKGDLVYHLGDVAFGKGWLKLIDRLEGRKRLILGNHDKYESKAYLQYFEKLYGMVFWEGCLLSHMPCHPKQLHFRAILNVHGHLHGNMVKLPPEAWEGPVVYDKRYFNVSCEQNFLTPVHRDVILERVKELKEAAK